MRLTYVRKRTDWTLRIHYPDLMVTLPACENDGPLEEAGEEVEEGVEETGDAVGNTTD